MISAATAVCVTGSAVFVAVTISSGVLKVCSDWVGEDDGCDAAEAGAESPGWLSWGASSATTLVAGQKEQSNNTKGRNAQRIFFISCLLSLSAER
jgi:hypothetical protein